MFPDIPEGEDLTEVGGWSPTDRVSLQINISSEVWFPEDDNPDPLLPLVHEDALVGPDQGDVVDGAPAGAGDTRGPVDHQLVLPVT